MTSHEKPAQARLAEDYGVLHIKKPISGSGYVLMGNRGSGVLGMSWHEDVLAVAPEKMGLMDFVLNHVRLDMVQRLAFSLVLPDDDPRSAAPIKSHHQQELEMRAKSMMQAQAAALQQAVVDRVMILPSGNIVRMGGDEWVESPIRTPSGIQKLMKIGQDICTRISSPTNTKD